MVNEYIPNQGDIIFLDFNPIKDHEQSGYRPALVISNKIFNEFTKMCIVCPITNNIKYFPTHYTLNESSNVNGAVLCEHIRSIDYESRKIKFVEKITEEDFKNIHDLLSSCIETK